MSEQQPPIGYKIIFSSFTRRRTSVSPGRVVADTNPNRRQFLARRCPPLARPCYFFHGRVGHFGVRYFCQRYFWLKPVLHCLILSSAWLCMVNLEQFFSLFSTLPALRYKIVCMLHNNYAKRLRLWVCK